MTLEILITAAEEITMSIDEIIQDTVNKTVLGLKMAGLMKDHHRTPLQKTEDLLRNYNSFTVSGDPAAEQMIQRIEAALQMIQDDPYYDVITMYYISGYTREDIADRFNTSVTTISRNKTRLLKEISAVLFSADYIRQIYSV